MAERILVVEDHPDLLAFCAGVLERADYQVVQAGSGRAAETILRTSTIDAVVTDLKMPGVGGLDVLRVAKAVDPEIVVILITGFPTVETAVKAMKFGAFDYLMKPFSAEELLVAVEGALERRRAKEAYGLLKSQARRFFALGGIVGQSRGMLALFDDIRKAAEADANVLILGESGVGKERVARTIHENSNLGSRAFVAINCAAIPENLLESELFGYERGAFTGAHAAKEGLLEVADGGTLFLDELCELNPVLQAKLLRAVEEGSVRRVGGRKAIDFDVRFMASTNRDIHAEMRKGRFREDLFFRIDVIEIRVPPLRERREDVPLLAAHFLEACASRGRTTIEGIAQAALERLIRYDWPGNVRELRNAIERAAAYAKGPVITPDDLPEAVRKGTDHKNATGFGVWKQKTFERLQCEFLKRGLEEHGGNVSRAAKALGVHRSTLQRFMRRHNLGSMAS